MQLVSRIVNLLRYLAAHPEGSALLEISDALKMPMSTMHRLLAALEAEDFVARQGKIYHLGPDALGLTRGIRQVDQLARTHLTALTQKTHETSFLTEPVGDKAVCMSIVEGLHPLRLFVRVGEAMPLHAAASARTILAYQPLERVTSLLAEGPLASFTESTPTTTAAVLEHLSLVRARGYDICEDQLDPEVVAVSAPIFNLASVVVGSITVAAPKDRLAGRARDEAVQLVMEHAAAVSTQLGYDSSSGEAPSAYLEGDRRTS